MESKSVLKQAEGNRKEYLVSLDSLKANSFCFKKLFRAILIFILVLGMYLEGAGPFNNSGGERFIQNASFIQPGPAAMEDEMKNAISTGETEAAGGIIVRCSETEENNLQAGHSKSGLWELPGIEFITAKP